MHWPDVLIAEKCMYPHVLKKCGFELKIFVIFDYRSSVGPEFAKAKAIFFLILSVILFVIGGGVVFFTYSNAKAHSGYFIIHIGKYYK